MKVSQIDVQVVLDRVFPNGFDILEDAEQTSADGIVDVKVAPSDWKMNVEVSIRVKSENISTYNVVHFFLRLQPTLLCLLHYLCVYPLVERRELV